MYSSWFSWMWSFKWPWTPADTDKPTNPILLIPGICGTQLGVRKKTSKDETIGERVWVCLTNADSEYKRLWGRVNPDTHHLDLLDETEETFIPIGTTAGDGGLYPIDLLDPALYIPLHVVYYYHNMIWYLKQHQYEPGKTLFGFGYDFRQSNSSHLDALVKQLEDIVATNKGAKVDVVTHSMGGLVMRSLLADRPEEYSRLVRKWIAMASPFGGAPGFTMDALLTGVEFAQGWEQYFFVNRSTMHTMCSQAPAVFELMPDPVNTDVWPLDVPAPVATIIKKGKDDKDPVREDYSLQDFPTLMREAMKGFTVTTYSGKKVTLEMDSICWDISDKARTSWRTCKLPESCQFFNAFGTGFETAYGVQYGSESTPLGDYTDITKDPFRSFTYIDGDATVPVCCATADGLTAVERQGFFSTHRGILELPPVWEKVMSWIELPMDDFADPDGLEATSHRSKTKRHSEFRERLRPVAHARTKSLHNDWVASARPTADAGDGSVGRGSRGAGKHSDVWCLVSQPSHVDADSSTTPNPLLQGRS